MPGKRKSQSAVTRTKSRGSSTSTSTSRSASGKKKSGRKSAKQTRAKSAPGIMEGSEMKREPDLLDPIPMENLYYTAHSAVAALELRGFKWDGAPKKKGKKGKKKK